MKLNNTNSVNNGKTTGYTKANRRTKSIQEDNEKATGTLFVLRTEVRELP